MVIALVGRRIDPPNLRTPVFPCAEIERVRRRILEFLKCQHAKVLVCSAACGADLLALEVAGEMGIRRRIILPFRPELFREISVVDRPGDWGPLFDRVTNEVKAKHDLVNLNTELDTDASYLHANQVILDEAMSLAAASGDGTLAVLVWDGIARAENDITNSFGNAARLLGLQVFQVSTV